MQRYGSISFFSEIVWENYKFVQEFKNIFDNLQVQSSIDTSIYKAKSLALNHQISKHTVTIVVFSAILIEAYIYDYAARNISDTFAQKYLDKLDTLSKIVVVTKLVTSKEFPTDKQVFELLKKVIRYRNEIVHHKSHPISNHIKLRSEEQNIEENLKIANECIRALESLSSEMENLDSNEYATLMFNVKSGKNAEFTSLDNLDEFPELKIYIGQIALD